MLALILAGCGGAASARWQEIRGDGYAFEAPSDWVVAGTVAVSGAVDRVQVTTFELERPYLSSKRAAVARELDGDAQELAQQLKGRVSGRAALEAGGLDAWTYDIAFDGKVEEITFALKDRREYELLCRRAAAGDDSACRELVASFRLRAA